MMREGEGKEVDRSIFKFTKKINIIDVRIFFLNKNNLLKIKKKKRVNSYFIIKINLIQIQGLKPKGKNT